MYNFDQVALSYLASFSLAIASTLILWIGVKEYLNHKRWRPVAFGFGLLLMAVTNMTMHILNVSGIYSWSVLFFIASFVLIYVSMIKTRWHYLFLFMILLPLLLPHEDYLYLFSLLGIVPLIFISGRKYCHDLTVCRNYGKAEEAREGREWGLFFFILILSFVPYFLSHIYAGQSGVLFNVIGAGLQFTAASVLYYHLFHSFKAGTTEKVLMPLMVGFVVIFLSMGFIVNNVVGAELKETHLNFLEEEANGIKLFAENASEGETLAERIEERDPTLNDLADEVSSTTGINFTFFLGDTRVAASVSANGQGRMLDTKLEDQSVINAVLLNGQVYRGQTVKGGESIYAVYVPIHNESGKVVGMIGLGKFLNRNFAFQGKLLMELATGASLIVIISIITITYVLPKRLKLRN